MIREPICVRCIFYRYEPEHISAHPEDDYPASWWCEEDMDNFGLEEGCYKYEERHEVDMTEDELE